MFRIIFMMSVVAFGCSTPKSNSWDEQNTRLVEFNSPEVKYAMELAQENLPGFKRHFEEYSADSTWSYFVKYGFRDKESTEHMWVNVLQVEPTIKGVLDNVPQEVTHVAYLDTVEFSSALVEDFIIYHADTLMHGDYLTDVIE